MKRRDALATVPAALYAAACHGDQDKPGTTPGASYPTPPKGGSVPVTEKVTLSFDGQLKVKPAIAVLKVGTGASLKWEVQIPREHTLEINFAVDYEGEMQLCTKDSSPQPKRGPFRQAANEVRGRYVARGPATLESGPADVQVESYWKYEVTVVGPDRKVLAAVDPGVILVGGGG
jgi:hypothetical protein